MLREDIFDSRLSSLFYPLGLFYGFLTRTRLLAYKKGILKRKELPGFVISVGNITLGGTGKTPAVMEIAEWARDKGYRVGILSRGYKGAYRGWGLVSDGKQIRLSPEQAGDEPYLMASRLNNVVVAVSKNRYDAGLRIARAYGIDFFILDDGFQHIRLKRDMDILLLNGKRPFANKRLFPSGPLREPMDHIKRADVYLITGGKKELPKEISHINRGKLFFATHSPELFILPSLMVKMPAGELKGKKIGAFAGIAAPERFKRTLKGLGVELAFFEAFPDHHWFKKQEIQRLLRARKEKKADYLVTTEKDWIRVMDMDKKWNIGYIRIRLDIDDKDRFFGLIDEGYQRYKTDTHKSHQLDR